MSGGFAFSIHVDGEGGVTELGDHVGTLAGVLVMTPPFVDDDDAGNGVVSGGSFGEGEVSVSGDVSGLVFDFGSGESG